MLDTHDLHLTLELHIIRAHLLQYELLLGDFSKSVSFIYDTPNPAMHAMAEPDVGCKTPDKRHEPEALAQMLEREVTVLLSEIARLESRCTSLGKKLKNVTDLVCTVLDARGVLARYFCCF